MAHESYADFGDDELVHRLASAKDDLMKLRFQRATGQLDNASAIRNARRQVARILTELRVREIAAAEALVSREESA